MTRQCCYVDQTTLVQCEALAEWEIYADSPSDPIFNSTDSCTAHVGELLSDAKKHYIYHLTSEEVA